jgi:hypothetical protein
MIYGGFLTAMGVRDLAARSVRRSAVVMFLLLVACAAQAGAAKAASSISITIGNDPVESIATQVGATGSTTEASAYLTMTFKPVGGAGCGANHQADTGTDVFSSHLVSQAGPYSYAVNETFDLAGMYLVCAWLDTSGNGQNVVATTSQVVTVRVPHLALTLGVPAAVNKDDTFQITTTTQAEAERSLFVHVLVDNGRGCPANASAAYSAAVTNLIGNRSIVGGPITSSTNTRLDTAGTYLVCGYVHYRSSSIPPQVSAVATLTVVAPPPPPPSCVVPAIVKDEPLASTKTRLAAASCAVGKVRYVASARYARGSVFKFAPVPGTTLPNAAPIGLFVSSGAPCIVPRIPKSRSLATVKRRLAASGCTVGKVSHRHSTRRKRGRVISLSARSGKRLSPRAKVRIVVSRGR